MASNDPGDRGGHPLSPPKKPKKKAAPKDDLTKQENQIFGQMSSDISQEGKASPSKLKSLTQQITEDQYKEDSLTGLGHPDAQSLIKAGVPASKVSVHHIHITAACSTCREITTSATHYRPPLLLYLYRSLVADGG